MNTDNTGPGYGEAPPPLYASHEEAEAGEKKKADEKDAARKRELVTLARARFGEAEEAESELRRLADEDIRFRAGEQWDADVLRIRKEDKRPALVINRMPQFERQITNEQRQSRPAMQVSPVDSGADKETATVHQGLIRHIESDSNADVAYDTALTSAVRGGLGYFRIVTEWETEGSFEQCIKIKRVRDPSSVYLDPSHHEPDGSDANWGFVVDDGISQESFKAEYPDCTASEGGWGQQRNTQAMGRTCQVVEYFYRERVADELLHIQPTDVDPASGQPMPSGEPITTFRSELPPDGIPGVILDSRPTHRLTCRWAKIAGDTVIDEREFPSKWIPLIPVLGDELWVGGRRILEGVVRHAKDPQRMYNFWASSITETIALAPKAPWIGPEKSFEGHEKEWAEAASRNKAYLQYRPVTVGGSVLPPPTRNTFEAPIGAMTTAMQFAADDMKGTTGIYDAALGNRSNEQTGVAIRSRQAQSQVSTMHFADNLGRALKHAGRILIDLIPKVYSSARVLRILGEDQTEKMVGVNGAKAEGQERMFDLGTGRYDVTVSMGPSFASKRQEAVMSMQELSRSNPQIAASVADLMVKNMDWPGAEQISERLKKLLPPGIAEPDPKQKMDPAALAHQLEQAMQQNQQLSQHLHSALDKLETQAVEASSKERIALTGFQVDLMKTAATLDSKESIAHVTLLQKEADRIAQRLGMPDLQPQPPEEQEQPQPMNGAPNAFPG